VFGQRRGAKRIGVIGRARGALEAYHADIAYDGVWDDLAVRNWAIEVAQR